MKTSKTVAKLLFVVGALVYLLGLWISCPLLSGKVNRPGNPGD